jgi:hypothetical protein
MVSKSGKSGDHGKDVTVAPHEEGWSVTRQGNERASRVTDTKQEAVEIARDYAKQENSELVIKGADGKIQSKDSHGHDPKKSKG